MAVCLSNSVSCTPIWWELNTVLIHAIISSHSSEAFSARGQNTTGSCFGVLLKNTSARWVVKFRIFFINLVFFSSIHYVIQCHTGMLSLTYGHQTPLHRLLNAALHRKPQSSVVELPLLAAHIVCFFLCCWITTLNYCNIESWVNWKNISNYHGFYHLNIHVHFWCTVCTIDMWLVSKGSSLCFWSFFHASISSSFQS